MRYKDNTERILDSFYDEKDNLYEKVLTKLGSTVYYKNGEYHRTYGPAVRHQDVTTMWYLDGKLHRSGGPAIEESDGTKEHWIHGKLVKVEISEPWFSLLYKYRHDYDFKIVKRNV